MHPSEQNPKKGFTLIELLVVIAVIALLAVAAAPAFNAIASSSGVGQGAYDISGILELARSEAVARQTYVWVGIQNTTNAATPEIMAGAVYSKDGSGTNLTATNLQGLTRVIHVRNVKLANWASLQPATKSYLTNDVSTNSVTPVSVSSNSVGATFNIGRAGFTNHSITFTPTGEALLKGSVTQDEGFDPYIDVSFQQTKGNIVPPNAEEASVVVDGATGVVHILRLK